MVCEQENFMLTAFQIVLPSGKHFNNGQQLLIIGFIPYLNSNHLLRKKGHWMPLVQAIRDQLTENPTGSIARCIRFNLDITLQINMIWYQSFNKCLFQFDKGSSSFGDKE